MRLNSPTSAAPAIANAASDAPAPLDAAALDALNDVVLAAASAAEPLRRFGAAQRCRLLERIALELEAIAPAMAGCAAIETGALASDSEDEHRAVLAQLHAFISVLRRRPRLADMAASQQAAAQMAATETAMRARAVGPVAVLGAGCLTPVYGAAGADVLAALAAGCPVLVISQPLHPVCCAQVGAAIVRAVQACGLPRGTYGMVEGSDGAADALVDHPEVRAFTFSGSRADSLRLMRRALERSEPIPMLVDLPSSNPVFVLPGALNARAEHLGQQMVRPFRSPCSAFKPGIVLAIEGDGYIDLREAIIDAISAMPAVTMPNPGIQDYHTGAVDRMLSGQQVSVLAEGARAAGVRDTRALFAETDAGTLLAMPALMELRPGPAGLLVRCSHASDMLEVAAQMPRQHAATMHVAGGDETLAAQLLPQLERMARHIGVNSFRAAPLHDGPAALEQIARFQQPVFYHDVPRSLLSTAPRDSLTLQRWRQFDREWRQ